MFVPARSRFGLIACGNRVLGSSTTMTTTMTTTLTTTTNRRLWSNLVTKTATTTSRQPIKSVGVTVNNAVSKSIHKSDNSLTTIRPFSSIRKNVLDLREIIADDFGVRLTEAEYERLRQKIDLDKDGKITRADLQKASLTALEFRSGRELCLSVIEQPLTWWDRLVGQHALRVVDVAGTLLYAVAGTQVAGDFGMNIVGCTLVGCATALGGGTLNNMLYGASSNLHTTPGVFWVRSPSYLFMAAGASILTFFLWPYYTQAQADYYLKNVIGKENLNKDGSVGRRAFLRACGQNEQFLQHMRAIVKSTTQQKPKSKVVLAPPVLTPQQIFDALDEDKSGTLSRTELRKLTQRQFDNSTETYVIDTLALASFAVAAAHSGINAGVHPMVACTAGVTICFGGIIRDVLCGRPIAIGAQSYAFATGAGATMYVALRELCVRGFHTSLFTRIVLAATTTMGIRYWEHERGEPILDPMHAWAERK